MIRLVYLVTQGVRLIACKVACFGNTPSPKSKTALTSLPPRQTPGPCRVQQAEVVQILGTIVYHSLYMHLPNGLHSRRTRYIS